MEEQGNSKQYFEVRPIELEPGIYNLIPSIENSLINGTPLSDSELNIFKTFNRHFNQEFLSLSDLQEAKRFFNFEDTKEAVEEGFALAQAINSRVKIEQFPVIFLFMPGMSDATSLEGQGCGINIESLKPNDLTQDSQYQRIVSYVAHESVHVFLKQLGKNPPPFSIRKNPLYKGVHGFLWEEGLTTYIQPTNYRHHKVFQDDARFWIYSINKWLQTKSVEQKRDLFKNIINRESTKFWLKDMYKGRYNFESINTDSLDEYELNSKFWEGLTNMNGPGYHIGSYIWQKKIEEGNNIKDLVMAGSDEMSKWIKEVL